MPEHIGDLLETGAAVNHLGGRTMAKGVRTQQGRIRNAGAEHGALRQLTDRGSPSKGPERRSEIHKDEAARTGGSALTEIYGEGVAHFVRQR